MRATAPTEAPPEPDPGSPRIGPKLIAAIFVVPYLLMMLAWAFSNPPAAAPDEPDHLVKALGMARLDIGSAYLGPPANRDPVSLRNASISRVVPIPARLSPAGLTCEAFQPTHTAACLLHRPATGTGTTNAVTPLGSYPPFLYVPIGLVASLAATPSQAFIAGRCVCILMSALLIWLGCAHLVRWLGRRALLGAFLALTPMVVFIGGSVSLSGPEICSAFAVAAVAITAIRRPDSLRQPGTQLLFGALGAVLILSRQLGIVTFGAVVVLLVFRLGWRFFWRLVSRPRPAFLAAVGLLLGAAVAVEVWERRYDHPVLTGAAVSRHALGPFGQQGYWVVRSAIGQFGWLDTAMPGWCYVAYLAILFVVVGIAIVLGSRADRWSLVAWLVGTVVLAYVTYSIVFYPVGAGLQGRHMLPFFMMVPLLAGVVVGDSLGARLPAALRWLAALIAVVIPVLQFVGLYLNARRYAVGANGPILFLSKSQWHPLFGWVPWLLGGLAGAVLLSWVIVANCVTPTEKAPTEKAPTEKVHGAKMPRRKMVSRKMHNAKVRSERVHSVAG